MSVLLKGMVINRQLSHVFAFGGNSGITQGAENWGCKLVSRSNEGKITEDFLALSPKKLWVYVRAPCASPVLPSLGMSTIIM